MDYHQEPGRQWVVLDREGDPVVSCDDLLEAVCECPEDGAIVDRYTGRTVTCDDLATVQL